VTLIYPIVGFVVAFGLAGCANVHSQDAKAAVVLKHDEQSLEELSGIMTRALNRPVALNELAFAKSNRLALENRLQQTIEHGVIDGKVLTKPPLFELLLVGEQCFLSYPEAEQRWLLSETQCSPLN
jgi:hypothetical protein